MSQEITTSYVHPFVKVGRYLWSIVKGQITDHTASNTDVFETGNETKITVATLKRTHFISCDPSLVNI